MMNKNTYSVIMAGGIGSRFWPMSTEEYPKQFHDVLGIGRTLIQLTYDRLLKFSPSENIYIVTNEDYKTLILKQLPEINENQILCEPSRKNTAPCIAYACHKIHQLNNKATVIIAPSDHIIMNEREFIDTIHIALDKVNTDDVLMTLGIKPHRPDTGYGYIQFESDDAQIKDIRKVKTFTEKPNKELAISFIESGEFYWNSGIFVWSTESILRAFSELLPEINDLFLENYSNINTSKEKEAIDEIYAVCKNISIDYGIMEVATNVYVVLSDFGWSDLGTWGSLYTLIEKDTNQNSIVAHRTKLYESKGNMIYSATNKLIAIHGLNDYIVVDTNEALLICKKDDEQEIKAIVNDIKLDETLSF